MLYYKRTELPKIILLHLATKLYPILGCRVFLKTLWSKGCGTKIGNPIRLKYKANFAIAILRNRNHPNKTKIVFLNTSFLSTKTLFYWQPNQPVKHKKDNKNLPKEQAKIGEFCQKKGVK